MSIGAVAPVLWYRSLDRSHWNTLLATILAGCFTATKRNRLHARG